MAKQNPYTVLSQNRANFYLKGSPVQLVLIELLREEATGDTLVTLTYKNIFQRSLTYCKINFVCKNALGQIIAEDNFVYEGIAVGANESFGSDEAVFVSNEHIAAVEANLVSIAFDNGRVHDISTYEKVRLPELKPLSEMMVGVVGSTVNSSNVAFRPVQLAEGWQCTCGAFNYNADGRAIICDECGVDKAMLFSSFRSAEAPSDMGTKVFSAVSPREEQPLNNETKAFSAQRPQSRRAANKYSLMSDATAEFINKFVPLIAVGASVVFVLGAFLMKQLLL